MKPRIERVIEDLSSIQRDLNSLLIAEVHAPDGASAAPGDMERLKDMRQVLDQVRHFLWFYLRITGGDGQASQSARELLCSPQPDVARRAEKLLESLGSMSQFLVLNQDPSGNRKPN